MAELAHSSSLRALHSRRQPWDLSHFLKDKVALQEFHACALEASSSPGRAASSCRSRCPAWRSGSGRRLQLLFSSLVSRLAL